MKSIFAMSLGIAERRGLEIRGLWIDELIVARQIAAMAAVFDVLVVVRADLVAAAGLQRDAADDARDVIVVDRLGAIGIERVGHEPIGAPSPNGAKKPEAIFLDRPAF
jgi:hypothetical protein